MEICDGICAVCNYQVGMNTPFDGCDVGYFMPVIECCLCTTLELPFISQW
jgi:hypothetical protein